MNNFIAPEEESEAPAVDLSSMTKAELIAYAEELGLTVSSSMTKAQIIEVIQNA